MQHDGSHFCALQLGAAWVIVVPRDLARAVGLRLPLQQLGVNSVALDETVNPIAPAPTALVALDGKDVALAGDIAV